MPCVCTLLVLLVIHFVVSIHPHAIVFGPNGTLAPCTTDDDCRPGLSCIYFNGNSATFCDVSAGTPCRCEPFGGIAVFCNSSTTCPIAEGCALSKISGKTFCVDCNVINDPATNYTAFGSDVCSTTPSPFPTPSASPGPPGRALDLCSSTFLCASDLSCYGIDGYSCKEFNPPCFCISRSSARMSCSTSTDCKHELETCLRFTLDNSTACGSCSLLKSNPEYISVSNDNKCGGADIRPIPDDYAPSRGLSFDVCTKNADCFEGYKCMNTVGKQCNKEDFICACLNTINGTFPSCTNTSDCHPGEVCVQGRDKTIGPRCMSFSVYQNSAPGLYDVLGELPKRGNLSAYDKCRADHQCAAGLFCTHQSESGLGGCLGRKGCACTPIYKKQCARSNDCHAKEACVVVPGGQMEPFCYSEKVAKLDPLVSPVPCSVEWTRIPLPTGGWVGDGCVDDSDCRDDIPRTCVHLTENQGKCNGRQTCICRFQNSFHCRSSADCGEGERCAIIVGSKKKKKAICLSAEILRLEINAGLYVERVKGGKHRPFYIATSNANPLPTTKLLLELF